ncbi:type IV pilus-associated protein PilC1 [Neisseria meningitidis]|nr:type IV pilus-associated protein PilC1 [Neisseria meningitidis]
MFKAVLLGQWHSLSDPELEHSLITRIDFNLFCRFDELSIPGSGTFKEGKKPARNNRCFSGKGVRTLLMNDLDSLDITGPTCGMKRISWREVFY